MQAVTFVEIAFSLGNNFMVARFEIPSPLPSCVLVDRKVHV